MSSLVYPKKPWKNNQVAFLLPNMEFVYSSSLRKWVPRSPGTVSAPQIETAFGGKSIQEIVQTVEQVDTITEEVDTVKQQVVEFGRIWKSEDAPQYAAPNDLWVEPSTGKLYYWVGDQETWMQININMF